jgi:murein DD-endopeptidase MepM/ murein hydrolase activator NlpD
VSAPAPEICAVCGGPIDERDRFVLVRGRRQQAHCSETCLSANARHRIRARARARRRVVVTTSALAALALGAGAAWRRHHTPPPRSISYAWPDVHGQTPPPAPTVFGPPWPPTEAQWIALFDRADWTFPLPGPERRPTTRDPRVFGPEPPRDRPALCRERGHCGVDLGGDLWGEHVYAALDGVVERVQGDGNERHGGLYVRLVHFGGAVFTQYFHLAAIPRAIVRGAHVSAGDVIGLLGDTGLEGERRHLHFALSVRPASYLSEVYWDPRPWLDRAVLRVPPRGTVAGFAPPETRGLFK